MIYLANEDTKTAGTMWKFIENSINNLFINDRKCSFYYITCSLEKDINFYVNFIDKLRKQCDNKKAKLVKLHIYFDSNEIYTLYFSMTAFKNRFSKYSEKHKIDIELIPVSFGTNKLHAKALALMTDPGPISFERKGFVITTSANLTKNGLGFNFTDNKVHKDRNIEIGLLSDNPEALNEFHDICKKFQSRKAYPQQASIP